MKSLSFKKLNVSEADVLTKLQMKKIFGGYDGGGSGCDCGCKNDSECVAMVCNDKVTIGDCGTIGQTCHIHQCVPK